VSYVIIGLVTVDRQRVQLGRVGIAMRPGREEQTGRSDLAPRGIADSNERPLLPAVFADVWLGDHNIASFLAAIVDLRTTFVARRHAQMHWG